MVKSSGQRVSWVSILPVEGWGGANGRDTTETLAALEAVLVVR